ncbi:MAG TPA: SUMF1/EgtB/PvdO family nonheme iron enzyme [Anaerolineae bacterium]|nr:SUMF1/EgtB/PvdO family nonheme iron enzyme [Anaerolineae bacterium]
MNLRKVGRYELISELGRGGMATVYRARDPFFDRDVAIKLLPREFLHDPTFKARFEREAKTIAALEHSAIVPVHDFGEEEGQPFLVMRYMSGGSLVNRLEQRPLTFEEISTIVSRIATALDEAHKKGMIHRDLKPGNILFDAHEDAFLSDFGIVKLTQETATFTGSAIIGTPAYMNPEQARGDPALDPRSDVYALGVILFEMLSGKPPYEADTPMGLAVKHITEPVPSILEVKPDLPPNFELMIKRALAKEPEDRYASAGELAKEFTEMVASERSYARPPIPTLIEETPEGLDEELPEATLLEEPAAPKDPAQVVQPIVTPDLRPEQVTEGVLSRYRRYFIAIGGILAVAIIVLLVAQRPTSSTDVSTPPTSSDELAHLQLTETEESLIPSAETVAAGLTREAQIVSTMTPTITPTARSKKISTPTSPGVAFGFNSIDESEMVYIPPGPFMMGSSPEVGYVICLDFPPEDKDPEDCQMSWFNRESPPHEVYLSGYWIHTTEVTISQYTLCVKDGACRSNDQRGRPPDHPVTNITWEWAREYCQWAGLDLPTEAQWEKAARGPTDQLWPWGDSIGVEFLNSVENNINNTTAVGSYPSGASYYGLLDMAGNVWEFVFDWFDKEFYSSAEASQPDPTGPSSSPLNQRVRRGGSYGGEGGGDFNDARVSARQGIGPSYPSYEVGFRCAGSALP